MGEDRPALGADERRFRDYFSLSPDAIFVADGQGRYLEVNQAAARLTGFSREELVTMSIPDILSPEGQKLADSHFAQVREIGRASGDIEHQRKDGTRLWMTVDAVKISDDRFVAYCKDITHKRQTEASLRQVETRFRALMTHTQGIIYVIDPEGIFTLSEGRGLARLGLEPGQVVGQSAYEIYADYPQVVKGIQAALAGEPTHALTKIGDIIFDVFYSPMHDEDGSVAGTIGMAIEVTDRIQAEEERRRIAEQMERTARLESLGVLAGGIAHDFNNLLMSILGSAELVARSVEGESLAGKGADRIITASEQASSLCQQLLAYAGRAHLETRPFDLSSCIEEMVPLLDVAVSSKITVEWALEKTLPHIDGDPGQLRQVALNMVTNASEAIGDRAGTLRVRTYLRDYSSEQLLSFDLIGNHAGGRYVCLEVSDTGAGMTEETRSRIFDPFFTTKVTGRGLGMASARGIIHAHQGGIRIESTLGQGSTITVLFPARADRYSNPETDLASLSDPSARAAGTLLVVDDEQMVRTTARLLLESEGYTVVEAVDGVAALEILDARPGDFEGVLLDLTMPRMSGSECRKEIRTRAPELPIVLSSGFSEEAVRELMGDDPFCTFVQKPYRIDVLIAAFDLLLTAPASAPGPQPIS